MHATSMLHIGVADFAEPTLLFLGDGNSLAWLADQIEAEHDIDFAELPNVALQPNFNLRILFAERHGELRRRKAAFVWEVSAAEALHLAAQIRSLARNTSPAHTYLDPHLNLAGVEVVASLGEYDPSRLFL